MAGMTMNGFLTDCWYVGCPSSELRPGRQVRRLVLGEPVLFGRTQDRQPFALRDVCPHRLVPLSAGRQVDTGGAPTVECPYHGWRFGTDGVCRTIPSLTDADGVDPARIRVRRYPVTERHGLVFVHVADSEGGGADPAIAPPELGDQLGRTVFSASCELGLHMDEVVSMLLSPVVAIGRTAAGAARPGASGGRGQDRREPVEPCAPLEANTLMEPMGLGWVMAGVPAMPRSLGLRTALGNGVRGETIFQLPGFICEHLRTDSAGLSMLSCLTPEGPERTRITRFGWWSGRGLGALALPMVRRAMRRRFEQDIATLTAASRQGTGTGTGTGQCTREGTGGRDRGCGPDWYDALKRSWLQARRDDRPFVNPIAPPSEQDTSA